MRILGVIIITSVTFSWRYARAAEDYSPVPACARLQSIKVKSCTNAKVEFDVADCPNVEGSLTSPEVSCEGSILKIRTSTTNYRFEAKFKSVGDGWGGANWQSSGPVLGWKKSVAIKDAHRSPSQAAAPQIEFNGFLDFRHTRYSSDLAGVDTSNGSGFLVDDAALYVNYKKGDLGIFLDIPFARGGDTLTDSGGDTATIGSGTGSFAVTTAKAQAYGKYKLAENTTLVFGQFDTMFGLELNDSKDRVFGNPGLVYGQTLPTVHDGVYVEQAWDKLTFRLMVANPSDRDTLGKDDTDDSYEFGATVGYANDWIRGQVGYLMRDKEDLQGEVAQRTLTDALFGVTYNSVTVDLEYSIVSDPRKDTLTTDPTDQEDPGTGLAVLVTYSFLENWKLGARFETITDDPSGGGVYKKTKTSAATVHYKVDENLTARLEHYVIDLNEDNDDQESYTTLSGILTF